MRQWTRLLAGRLQRRPLQVGPPHGAWLHSGPLRLLFGLCVVSATSWVHPTTANAVYTQETSAEDQRTVWDGVYTEGQAERGQVLYTEACSACHAADLRGDNTSPSLVGMSFVFLWGGSTLFALFERIQERMPPDRPGTLSAQTYRDILAFVLRENSYPAGAQELEMDRLEYILIAANRDTQR